MRSKAAFDSASRAGFSTVPKQTEMPEVSLWAERLSGRVKGSASSAHVKVCVRTRMMLEGYVPAVVFLQGSRDHRVSVCIIQSSAAPTR